MANPAGDLVYTPTETAALTVRMIDGRQQQARSGVPLYIAGIDDYFSPMRPGELITVIGRPSNYKSGLMQHIARHEAMRLARDNIYDKYVVYMTWEQAVEEMVIYELSSFTGQSATDLLQGKVANRDALIQAATMRGELPLWIFGHSLERRSRRPRMTMPDAEQALRFVEDEFGMRPSLIVLDYLQRIAHHRPQADPRMNFVENVDRCKDMALEMACPVMMGCQAKREVDARTVKIPQMGDGQETSNVEHSSDAILTVHMPKTAYPIDEPLPLAYPVNTIVTENLLLVSVAKRKLGRAGAVFPMYVRPEINKIAAMELRELNL